MALLPVAELLGMINIIMYVKRLDVACLHFVYRLKGELMHLSEFNYRLPLLAFCHDSSFSKVLRSNLYTYIHHFDIGFHIIRLELGLARVLQIYSNTWCHSEMD